MTALLSLAILFLIAFIGSYVYKKINISAFWLSGIVYSGIFYILLGYLIGPRVLNFITEEAFHELNVLFTLVLGWAGFLTGLQLSIKRMKRFPTLYYSEVTLSYLAVFLLLALLLWILNLFISNQYFNTVDLVMFSVVGAISSPIMLGVLLKDYRVPGRLSYRLQFNAAYDNILGVIAGGLVIMMGGWILRQERWPDLQWIRIVFPYLVVVAAVFLYNFIYNFMRSKEEKFLLFISLLILSIGTAYHFKQSILFISFLFGFGLANSKVPFKNLYRDIQELEKPLYILLLIFAGINLKIYTDPEIMIFLLLLFFLRLILKYVLEHKIYKIFEKDKPIPKAIGIAGIGMGGLSLAMALDYLIICNTESVSIFLFIIIASLVPSDVLSIEYLKTILIKGNVDNS
ncbi:MAG TPA: hypothetical protein EYP36_12710 [Calditrichaeota bacterium]|nr:hypothetical protein [Calditrichota bacterium]